MDGRTRVGVHLRSARRAASLTQSQLEELSGIDKARISRYENDHVAPSIRTLRQLAHAIGVSEASLLGDRAGILQDFVEVMEARGIEIGSPEQGVRLAEVVADLIDAVGGAERLTSDETAPRHPLPAAGT